MSRGTEAYRQSLAYITGNNPGWTPRECKRMAYTYLLLTASPPLTLRERTAAYVARIRSFWKKENDVPAS